MKMRNPDTDESRKKRNEEALAEHARLARLFRDDRLAFERERKKMIATAIDSATTGENRRRMREFQESWDRKMKNAGSSHNRLILAQHLFWNEMKRLWGPVQK